jgi:hypothetical protein
MSQKAPPKSVGGTFVYDQAGHFVEHRPATGRAAPSTPRPAPPAAKPARDKRAPKE